MIIDSDGQLQEVIFTGFYDLISTFRLFANARAFRGCHIPHHESFDCI